MALHRPYIRAHVRQEVENRAERNEKGQFLDANTHEPIEGRYDLGHKAGHEHWREVEKAENEGLTQEQFNDRMNNPDLYQLEDPHNNRGHAYEDKTPETEDAQITETASSPPAQEEASGTAPQGAAGVDGEDVEEDEEDEMSM